MTIRFKCQHCQKPLSVKGHLAGKKAACPACKKAIVIPTPAPEPPSVDAEAAAAEAFADKPPENVPAPVSTTTIDFTCPYCDEEIKLAADLAGKKAPCPKCTQIITVPKPKDDKPKDWKTLAKTGPSAAKIDQPEALEGAWGSTTDKGKVSQAAMQEAGALPEPEAKPVGVGGWIKRFAWVCVIGGSAFFLVSLGMSARTIKIEKDHLKNAFKYLAGKHEPLLKAEYYRAAGEIAVRNFKAEDAKNNFAKARNELALTDVGPREDKAVTLDRDLLLIQLVIAQADLGGSGDEILKRGRDTLRLEWEEVQKEMARTLNEIHATEAKASALRQLGCKLMSKDKLTVAIGLAANLANGNPPLKAQEVGLLLAHKDDQGAAKLIPLDMEKLFGNTPARVGYTEGNAYKKDYAAALKIAKAKGLPAGRLEACIAGAAIILADPKNKDAAKEAAPFIEEGVTAFKEAFTKAAKGTAPVWLGLELIRLGSRTDVDVKSLIPQLPAPFRARAQLDIFQGNLDKSTKTEAIPDDSALDPKGSARGFAWEALARHQARLGDTGSLRVEEIDEQFRPFVHLGLALGEQKAK